MGEEVAPTLSREDCTYFRVESYLQFSIKVMVAIQIRAVHRQERVAVVAVFAVRETENNGLNQREGKEEWREENGAEMTTATRNKPQQNFEKGNSSELQC